MFYSINNFIVVYIEDTIIFGDNLRDRDNLSTMDKRPVPNVSVIRRFHCNGDLYRQAHFLVGNVEGI